MATRNPQTQAKRARELALRERRDRKRAKKAEAAAKKALGITGDEDVPESADGDDVAESEPTEDAAGA